jgi:hypothetical protein
MKIIDIIFAVLLFGLVLACRAETPDETFSAALGQYQERMREWIAEGAVLVESLPVEADPVVTPDDHASSDKVGNLPVAKTIGGFRAVDVRPALAKASPYNTRARDALALASASTPLADVATPAWKGFTPSAAQRELARQPIPAGTEVFTYAARKSSEMWVAVALWWDGSRWTAAQIGASRENKMDHLYAWDTANWIPAGWLYKDWSPTIPQSSPCVVVLLDYYRKAITYGVEVK